MGAARIRKLNGTYPTKEQIAEMELARLRADLDIPFVLSPADLKLPDVPDHARESVREFLALLVPKIPVKNGDCWRIAQQLFALANSPRVGYVEGVWTKKTHQDEHRLGLCVDADCDYEEQLFGAPHAWNTVDGHLVDLSVENKFRDWTPEDAEWYPLDNWWHETLRVYTSDDIAALRESGFDFQGGGSITADLIAAATEDEESLYSVYAKKAPNLSEEEIAFVIYNLVFQPASDRLEKRYEHAVREKAAA
jgi:hypothetical protein